MFARTALVTAALLAPVAALAQGSTATQTIDAMNQVWGKHPGYRANHAKGVVVEGNFAPSAQAASLSMATLFSAPSTPVIIRFSDATGVPTMPDAGNSANPHGMSMKFHLAAGDVDVVVNSLPYFPVATGEEFRDLLQAITVSGPDAPKPTKLEQFIAAHPTVAKVGEGVRSPTSFARETYNGVDAFIFVDAAGKRQPFRFKFEPVAGNDYFDKADADKQAPDVLVTELPQRLTKGTVAFRMMAQLANPGDQTKDPSQPWPADRRLVDMGTITITKAVPDSATAEKALRYLPNRLTPGIELSDDPLVLARVQAYVISFGRRAQ